MKKIKNPPEISQKNQPTIWTFYHCSSAFKYCDIVIKHCYKTFSMFSLSLFGPFRCSVFRCSVPFEVRSFDITLSTFGPIRRSVFRCSVPFDVRSFEVRSFDVQSFEVWSFEFRSRFRCFWLLKLALSIRIIYAARLNNPLFQICVCLEKKIYITASKVSGFGLTLTCAVLTLLIYTISASIIY